MMISKNSFEIQDKRFDEAGKPKIDANTILHEREQLL